MSHAERARLSRGALGAAVLLALVTAAPRALAYCRTSSCFGGVAGELCTPADSQDCGIPLWWPARCLGFSVQQDASSQVSLALATEVVRGAFDEWLRADCGNGEHPGFVVHDLGPVECAARQYNQSGGNANVVVFRDDAWPYAGQLGTLALTTVTFNVDTGEIYDADVEVNSADVTLTTGDTNVEYDLRSIITHEAGHVLGIAHSQYPDTTMGRQYVRGDTSLRDLATDDEQAICAVYPPVAAGAPGDPASCDPTPRHGFASACGPFPEPDDDGCAVRSVGAAGAGSAGLAWLAALLVGRRLRGAQRRTR